MRELFESTVRRICEDHVPIERVSAAEEKGWSPALWELFESSGFSQALAVDESGESGASWGDLCGVLMICGQYSLPLPLPEAMFANYLLTRSGLEAMSGSLSFGVDGDLCLEGSTVKGSLRDIPWGGDVDHVIGLVGTSNPMVVLMSRADAAQVNRTTNIAGEPRDELYFDGVTPLAVAPLAASMNKDVLKLGGAMLRSAQIAGAMQGVLALAAEYVNDRVQFGRPIARFQAVQHQLAICAEQTAATVVSAELACAQFDNGSEVSTMVAKISSAEAAAAGAAITHAVHGAIGFTQEYPLQLSTRRLWSWRSEYGSLSYWSQRLGSKVCAAGSDKLWARIVNASSDSTQESSI
ncbi:acyl-CoA/acyl-ACP dehydrogenase [Pseudomaricurvus alkylphenolicus]|uniref:acyl-CoA dehydrogenase family protein n=1 Tax=Pseudomaricurvus alkylphenolicus TaxID=1306991 RepID=UPI00141F6883|nr:acyl-CoA dehydrogenase family protein [Pseudomaricurvus alkylphenolicus]NIB44093.1 acyl-CoA/acyl-ACP dehydrogenase [Pseudomaricurvus alkylphenolicus]